MIVTFWTEISVAATLVFVVFGAAEIGRRVGLRHHRLDPDAARPQLGTIQASILGLLALLLGFNFSGAAARFIDRQDLMVDEANAIGTAWLRADLLDEPARGDYRKLLREYVDNRLLLSKSGDLPSIEAGLQTAERLQARMWSVAVDGVKNAKGRELSVLPPLNETIDLHAKRLSAAQRHAPRPVTALIVACAAIAIGSVGYGGGVAAERGRALTVVLAVLVVATLWVTIDLDHPREGLIRISPAPLEALQRTLAAGETSG
ncbi:MAG TPA: hypothetical protein VNC50_08375 [Planctomycetia bacterium]|nr:hypothetical protein [Planctomycetia bacterium]